MNIQRIARHVLSTARQVRRAFPQSTLAAIEQAIKASENAHAGEIRFAVEGGIEGLALLRGQSARERALEVFAQLRVWDTEQNNGLLIYLLLADRAVEIVADRGIDRLVGAREWSRICQQMEAAFGQLNFEAGVVTGVQEVSRHLVQHFPAHGPNANELPDQAVLL